MAARYDSEPYGLCPCGSGNKYKFCCAGKRKEEAVAGVLNGGLGRHASASVPVEAPLPLAATSRPAAGAAPVGNRAIGTQARVVVEKPLQQFATPKEIAKALKCSQRTVIRMADRGEFPKYVTVGGRKRFLFSEVEAWIAQRLGDRRQACVE